MDQQIKGCLPPIGALARVLKRVHMMRWLTGRRELLVETDTPASHEWVIVADTLNAAAMDTSRDGFRVVDCVLVVTPDGTSGWVCVEVLSW
jgi:hypothetical protein